jgi:hypothetical protein
MRAVIANPIFRAGRLLFWEPVFSESMVSTSGRVKCLHTGRNNHVPQAGVVSF